MVSARNAAIAMAIAPAAAAPWGFPTFTLPTFAFPTFTLPAFTLPTNGWPTPTPYQTTTTAPTAYTTPSKVSSSVIVPGKPSGASTVSKISGVSSAPIVSSTAKTSSSSSAVVITVTPSTKATASVTKSVSSSSKKGSVPAYYPPGTKKSTAVVSKKTTTSSLKQSTSSAATGASASKSKPSPPASYKSTSSAKASSSASKAASSSSKSSSSSSSKPSPTGGFVIGAPVNTTSGTIIGHEAPGTNGVSEYLGIPFALPPVGQLRFAPPVAYRGASTINASAFGADCPSKQPPVPASIHGSRLGNLLEDLGQTYDNLAEDCLFLNVWSKPQTGSAKKPVLVWIFGGGFNFGGTNIKAYNGKYFPDQEDVVFVSLNYRTNILGFPGAPGITQNAGLLDQRLAIEWVRDNIAAFGGDASRITIFGQSAGGMSVDLYSYAYKSDPIIAGNIMHSGNAFAFATRQAADAANAWYTASTAVGCGNSTTSTAEAVLACMRSANTTVTALENAANTQTGLGSLLGSYGPTVDEVVVFSDYKARGAAGNFAQVPTLVGNTNKESGLLILISAGAGQVFPQNVWDSIDLTTFTCPASYTAQDRAAAVPTWRYYYGGMYPNLLIPTANISQAWHTSDIPVLFGTTQDSTGEAPITPEVELGNYMRKAWATFAANPASGLSQAPFNWPLYQQSAQTLVLLGQDNATTAAYALPASVDSQC